MKERGVGRYANVVLQYLRQMFRFAITREIVAADPTFGLMKKDVGGKEGERERVLSQDEIRELAARLSDSGLSLAAQSAFWLMLSTCCRVGELSKAQWADFNTVAGTWRIPAENSKNGRAHLIHLSSFALGKIEAMRGARTSTSWLFPMLAAPHRCVSSFCCESFIVWLWWFRCLLAA